tara:strand:+ start:500 stop:700 length:201 start_codon:yes stop_codon:yes gene_type:complete
MSKEANIPKEIMDRLTAYNKDLIEMIPNITNEELLECLTMVSRTAFKEGSLYGIKEVRNMINWSDE